METQGNKLTRRQFILRGGLAIAGALGLGGVTLEAAKLAVPYKIPEGLLGTDFADIDDFDIAKLPQMREQAIIFGNACAGLLRPFNFKASEWENSITDATSFLERIGTYYKRLEQVGELKDDDDRAVYRHLFRQVGSALQAVLIADAMRTSAPGKFEFNINVFSNEQARNLLQEKGTDPILDDTIYDMNAQWAGLNPQKIYSPLIHLLTPQRPLRTERIGQVQLNLRVSEVSSGLQLLLEKLGVYDLFPPKLGRGNVPLLEIDPTTVTADQPQGRPQLPRFGYWKQSVDDSDEKNAYLIYEWLEKHQLDRVVPRVIIAPGEQRLGGMSRGRQVELYGELFEKNNLETYPHLGKHIIYHEWVHEFLHLWRYFEDPILTQQNLLKLQKIILQLQPLDDLEKVLYRVGIPPQPAQSDALAGLNSTSEIINLDTVTKNKVRQYIDELPRTAASLLLRHIADFRGIKVTQELGNVLSGGLTRYDGTAESVPDEYSTIHDLVSKVREKKKELNQPRSHFEQLVFNVVTEVFDRSNQADRFGYSKSKKDVTFFLAKCVPLALIHLVFKEKQKLMDALAADNPNATKRQKVKLSHAIAVFQSEAFTHMVRISEELMAEVGQAALRMDDEGVTLDDSVKEPLVQFRNTLFEMRVLLINKGYAYKTGSSATV